MRQTNPILRRAFPLVIFFLAAMFTGILEKIPFLRFFHVLTVAGGLALIAIALSGRIRIVVLQSPIGKALTVFTIWMILCIPFAIWRGGSAALLVNIWSRSALSYVLLAGSILTIQQGKTIFKTIGYSVGALATLTLALRGHDHTGRLGLLGTRYENANDFAWTLILGLSFLGFLLLRGNRRERLIALFLSAPILLALVKTGSRAGMIGLGMLVLFGFFQASRSVRIKMAAVVPILVVLLLVATPGAILTRYTTLFTPQGRAATQLETTAIGSSEERLQLLKDSLYLTLIHPIFGVGPADFPSAQNELALSRGQSRGAWRVTHNTYTQISSEMGIVGLIIYLVFLYQCFKPLNSIIRSKYQGIDWQDLRALAKSLRASFVVMLTIAIFDAYGYDTNIPIMAGIACALGLIAQRKRALMKMQTQEKPVPALPPEPALEPAWLSFQ